MVRTPTQWTPQFKETAHEEPRNMAVLKHAKTVIEKSGIFTCAPAVRHTRVSRLLSIYWVAVLISIALVKDLILSG